MIAQLFPKNNAKDDDENGGVCALCERLREKRLALDMLVRIVERLHEREVAARGLEHVEPSIHHDNVTFKRVAQADEVELRYVQGLVDQLIEAAEVLDREFINQKSECNGKIVSPISKITFVAILLQPCANSLDCAWFVDSQRYHALGRR
jgi:hypothetical protein